MKFIKTSLLSIALVSSFAISAAPTENESMLLNNSNTIGYVTSDSFGETIDGYSIQVNRQWANDFYVGFDYMNLEGDYSKNYMINAVIGKQFKIDNISSWEIEGGARVAAVEYMGMKDDETFATVAANYKRMVCDEVAMTAGVDYVDGTTSFVVGAEYDFSNSFGVSFNYLKNSDEDTMMLNFVYRPGM